MNMQIFELHFNPKTREDRIFDSFVYEPETAYEKKLGSLYMVGELQNILSQNGKFLNELAQNIKKDYYSLSFRSPERALTEALKKANEFLSEKVKQNNVDWLGNLNFAAFSLKEGGLTFTKTGGLKILMIRSGQITDIAKSLDIEGIDPYPLKIFFNVVSGRLMNEDLILVLTKEIFDFFSQQGVLKKIAELESFEEKKIREIIPPDIFSDKKNSGISGLCFLIAVKPAIGAEEKLKVLFQKQSKFSFSEILSPVYNPIRNITAKLAVKPFQNKLNLLKSKSSKPKKILKSFKKNWQNKKYIPDLPFFKKLKPKTEKQKVSKKEKPEKNDYISIFKNSLKTNFPKKNLILVSTLIILLFFGFLIFKEKRERKIELEGALSQIEVKVQEAENFLIFKQEGKANFLLLEAWEELLPLAEEKSNFEKEIADLQQSVEEKLKELNKLEDIKEPRLLFEMNNENIGFSPEKMLKIGFNFYFYSPASKKIYDKNSGKTLEISSEITDAKKVEESPLIFSLPDNLYVLKNSQWLNKKIILQNEPAFSQFLTYTDNLYFLDNKNCNIVKYSYLGGSSWGLPQIWLKKENSPENLCSAKSMAADGSIWIVNENNTLSLYHKGAHKETLNLSLFPVLNNINKIETNRNTSHLYILDEENKRIILTDKKGIVQKQFQSEKFSDLKDLAVSEDGKTIWLLNGLKIYQITIEEL